MTNKPKRAGTNYETAMAEWWRGQGPPFDQVDRQPLRGIRDTGDLDGFPEVKVPGTGRIAWVVGCKAEATLRLGEYMDEMIEQGANVIARRRGQLAGVFPVELVKRRATGGRNGVVGGAGPRSYAVMEAATLAGVIRIMDLAVKLREGGD